MQCKGAPSRTIYFYPAVLQTIQVLTKLTPATSNHLLFENIHHPAPEEAVDASGMFLMLPSIYPG